MGQEHRGTRKLRLVAGVIAAACLLGLCSAGDYAAAGEAVAGEVVGQIGGSSYAVTIDPDRANLVYVGLGARVAVVDVSVPGEPVALGVSPVLASPPLAMVAADAIVYVLTGRDLAVVNARVPGLPQLIANVALREWTIRDGWDPYYQPAVALDNAYLYLVHEPWRLVQVYDVSDPVTPEQVSSLDLTGTGTRPVDIAAARGYAYVATLGDHDIGPDGGLAVFDVQRPSSPHLVSFRTVRGGLDYVAASGEYVLLHSYDCDLEIVDVSTPTNPHTVACSGRHASRQTRLIATEGMALLLDGEGAAWIYDWSDPTQPRLSGYFVTQASDLAVSVDGGHWYSASGSYGLRVFDVHALPRQELLGELLFDEAEPWYWDGSVAVRDGLAVVASRAQVRLADVSVPPEPSSLGRLEIPASAQPEWLDEGTLLIPSGSSVVAVDVRDPSAPRVVSEHTAEGYVHAIATTGDLVLVAGRGEGAKRYIAFLETVTFADPDSPRSLGLHERDLVSGPHHVMAEGGTAYFVAGSRWLETIDVSDPTRPTSLNTYRPDRLCRDYMALRGDLIYGVSSNCLSVIDVSKPAEPREVYRGSCPTGDSLRPTGLAVGHRHLYLGSEGYPTDFVWRFDLDNPAAPRFAGLAGLHGLEGLAVDDDRLVALTSAPLTGAGEPNNSNRLRLRIGKPKSDMDIRAGGAVRSPGYVEHTVAVGDLAYAATDRGLAVVDVSDPDDLEIRGTLALEGGADRLVVQGAYAYVLTPNRWVQRERSDDSTSVVVVDIRDPARPRQVGTLAAESELHDIAAAEGLLYCGGWEWLTIYDLQADPVAPTAIGRLRSRASLEARPGGISEIAPSGSTVAVIDFAGRHTWIDDSPLRTELRLVDVTDPSSPRLLSRLCLGTAESGTSIRDLVLTADRLYALADMWMWDAVYAYDLADPQRPAPIGLWGSGETMWADSIAVAGDKLLVGGWYGIVVLDLSGDGDPRHLGQILTPGTSMAAGVVTKGVDGTILFANGNAGLVTMRLDTDAIPTPTVGPSPTPRPWPTVEQPTPLYPTATAATQHPVYLPVVSSGNRSGTWSPGG